LRANTSARCSSSVRSTQTTLWWVGAGSRPRKQFYSGGQKKNQTVSATVTRKATALPLTTLLAVTLIVGEALVVAKAARVATTTNATASIRKMRSIIPAP